MCEHSFTYIYSIGANMLLISLPEIIILTREMRVSVGSLVGLQSQYANCQLKRCQEFLHYIEK